MKVKIGLLIAAVAVAIASPPTFADSPEEVKEAIRSYCVSIANLATTVMTKRQEGVSLTVLINALSDSGKHPELKQYATNMIMRAYETPRFNSDVYVTRSIQDFSNDEHLLCLRVNGGR